MAFCVECGTEGETVDGLCAKHFMKKHELVKAPEIIAVARCAHCARLKLPKGWVAISVENAIPILLAHGTARDPRVKQVQFTWVSREEDPSTVALTVKARCLVAEWELVTSFRTKIRVRRDVCPTDSRKRADYFVGTVQVRADGRPLTDEEGRRASRMAEDAKTGNEEFVSRIEQVRGGLDVRVSTNAFAKRLAKNMAAEFGGTVGASATLHTQREGREVYRSTYVVRVPAYRTGDVIRWRGARYQVEALGDPVRLRHLDSGALASVRLRDLRTARRGGE